MQCNAMQCRSTQRSAKQIQNFTPDFATPMFPLVMDYAGISVKNLFFDKPCFNKSFRASSSEQKKKVYKK